MCSQNTRPRLVDATGRDITPKPLLGDNVVDLKAAAAAAAARKGPADLAASTNSNASHDSDGESMPGEARCGIGQRGWVHCGMETAANPAPPPFPPAPWQAAG
jgi:hypothetical protein